jgi:LPS sulfotransferase NodH
MNTVIISSQRSGSTWLLKSLMSENSVSLGEFFNTNLQPHQKISLEVLAKLNFDEKEREQILKDLCRSKMPNYSLVKQFQKKILSLNNHCLIKIHHDQYLMGLLDTEKTLQESDAIIGLYRKNILLSYISFNKAISTKAWNSKSGIDKNELKLKWSKSSYNRFYKQKTNAINWIKSYKDDSKFVLFSYEEIHGDNKTEEEKVNYVAKKIFEKTAIKIDYNKNYENYLKRENNKFEYCDHFFNKEDFLRDSKEVSFFYEESL